ncbi:GTP-binding protein Era-like protein [Actinidia rufa]|uniref:GTP-binding protein Era-like protein n=1 Tax=Actinidia rufa TaxID=165716 RepID=A0A7J0E1H8_9ERIC|nr:GTP-binding protein Era-like protein [Actinidia rufa]
MELGLHLRLHLHHLSARSIDNRHSPIHCCSHSNFNSGADNPLLRRRFTFHHTHFHYKATPTSGRPKYTYRYRNSLAEGEGEYEDEDGEEEEVTTSLDGDDEVDDDESSLSGFLSLSVKPDRNMALLDDYELEELDALPDPNHRSVSECAWSRGLEACVESMESPLCAGVSSAREDYTQSWESALGYVAVLGKPNVGKSTLSNQMIGQKLSIVTDKPQTTRHRILGLCSGQMYQMILYDTPGVIEKKMHKLDSMMMKNVRDAAINADCALVVVDACKAPQKIDDILEEGVGGHSDRIPLLLVLNKTDLIKPGEIAKKLEWYEKFTDVDEVIPVSAKYGQGVDDVKDWILSKLPFGPAYYPKDIASEHPERFFVAEIVREKIFMQYRNEVPYACQVNVVTYKSRPAAKDFIQVEIVVEKNTQKIILIGKLCPYFIGYGLLGNVYALDKMVVYWLRQLLGSSEMRKGNEARSGLQASFFGLYPGDQPDSSSDRMMSDLLKSCFMSSCRIKWPLSLSCEPTVWSPPVSSELPGLVPFWEGPWHQEGKALKQLATAARLDIEDFLQKKVFLGGTN